MLKNTAASGVARVQLDANNSTSFAQLEVASAGGCTLNAPEQQTSLQNQAGTAPVVVETDGDLTYNYGLNALSDARLKENSRKADLEELQAIFDAAAPKCYEPHRRAAQEPAGLRGPGFRGRRRHGHRAARGPRADDAGLFPAHGRALGRLQEAASVDALEKSKKAKAKSRS